MDRVNKDYDACKKICSDAKEAALNPLKPYEKDESFEIRSKFGKISSDFESCSNQCYAQFQVNLGPIQAELLANTQKIQAAGGVSETAQAPTNADPDLGGKGIVVPPLSDPKKKNEKETECKKLIEFRDKGMYHLYQLTLTQFEINQEAKKDFLKYTDEIASSSKYFSTPAEGVYYLAQITKTTSNLIRNTIEITNKSFRPFNEAVDKLMASQVEGDDKIGGFQEVVFDQTCSLFAKDKGTLGSSTKAACTLVNDIKRFSTINTGIETTRSLLKSQMLMLKAQLEVYEKNLEKEKNNMANLYEMQAVLNEYLTKNCSK